MITPNRGFNHWLAVYSVKKDRKAANRALASFYLIEPDRLQEFQSTIDLIVAYIKESELHTPKLELVKNVG